MSSDGCTPEWEMDVEAGVEFVQGRSASVELVSIQERPRRTLALVTRGYTGKYVNLIAPDEQKENLEDLAKTKLKTPLAFINTVWLIRDVTRAWANQLERYKIGTAFVQQTLRFNPQNRIVVLKPSRLTGALAEEFEHGAREAVRSYHKAMAAGAVQEDARGLLPLNTMTALFLSANMQTLAHIYSQRMCCQAQAEEWTPIVKEMKFILRQVDPAIAEFLKAPWEGGEVSCGFGASFDRPCSNQEVFDKNLDRVVLERNLARR